jgi:hypothetical protein
MAGQSPSTRGCCGIVISTRSYAIPLGARQEEETALEYIDHKRDHATLPESGVQVSIMRYVRIGVKLTSHKMEHNLDFQLEMLCRRFLDNGRKAHSRKTEHLRAAPSLSVGLANSRRHHRNRDLAMRHAISLRYPHNVRAINFARPHRSPLPLTTQ